MNHIVNLVNDNSDVVSGYELIVTMAPNVPLSFLLRFGEVSTSTPPQEELMTNRNCIWVPKLKDEFSFLEGGGTMSSSIGPIPEDGGKFLPFLIKLRRIVESPSHLDDYTAAKEKAKDILKLGESCSDASLFLQKLYQNSDSNVFEFVLTETAEHTFKGLSFRHMEDLYIKGYSSVKSMLSAPDSVLLSLPGIGKAKLKKIRSNLES